MDTTFKRNGIFVKSLANGKINNYLRVAFLKSGRFAIETATGKPENWQYNMSMPIFETQREAEDWLTVNYEKMSVTASIAQDRPWVNYSDSNDGEPDYYRDVAAPDGTMLYMDGECLNVLDIDAERKIIMLESDYNDEPYNRFSISTYQFEADFVENSRMKMEEKS